LKECDERIDEIARKLGGIISLPNGIKVPEETHRIQGQIDEIERAKRTNDLKLREKRKRRGFKLRDTKSSPPHSSPLGESDLFMNDDGLGASDGALANTSVG